MNERKYIRRILRMAAGCHCRWHMMNRYHSHIPGGTMVCPAVGQTYYDPGLIERAKALGVRIPRSIRQREGIWK